MEYSLQILGKTKKEITFTLGKEEWLEDVKAAYNKNKHKYSVEGFRKGKVPMSVVAQRYGMDFLREEALDDTLNKYYGEIIKKESLEVIDRPEVDIKEITEDALKAVITVTVRPEAELGQYTGLSFTRQSAEVTEDEIKEIMNNEAEKHARMLTKEGEAALGDTVVLDYSGSVDGVKFDGGTAENQNLELGSNAFIPGFEDQIVGMKAGDSKDINVTFPKDYAESLAGKDAVFAITVHEVQTKEIPVFDDEFVKDIDDELETVDAWKAKKTQELSDRKKQNSEYALEKDILEAVINNSTMEIPDCMIEDEIDYRMQEFGERIKQFGMTMDNYLKYTGATVEDMRNKEKEDAIRDIKTRLVIEALVKKEDIKVEKEDIEAKLGDKQEKVDEQTFNSMVNNIVVEKLFKFLKENNEIKD